ncbi:DUF3801 domain-containing protein [Streptococcus sobrinus]|uniref:DUF3801 domain-containing protein n=1 Tax=Streptococcus sobrinus TaxID=1310 RepID=UPI0002F79D91|nr:DUF3801 domain-containing protein [Streptococcus sobrinus]
MDQKEITNRFTQVSLRTGEELFKMMAYLAQGTAEWVKAKREKRLSTGEKDVQTFIEHAKGDKSYMQFAKSDVNLTKLKNELKNYKINFAFEKLDDGKVNVWFKTRDQKVLESACEKIKNAILKDPKKVLDKVAKKETDKPLKEQIKEAKDTVKNMMSKGAKKPKLAKMKGKGK